jgi:hypothetical protein
MFQNKKCLNLKIVQIPKKFKFKKCSNSKSSNFKSSEKNRSAKPETGGKKPAKPKKNRMNRKN